MRSTPRSPTLAHDRALASGDPVPVPARHAWSRRPVDGGSGGAWSPVRTLETFGVPSARFDAAGRLVGVSRTASELLGPALFAVLEQATRLAGELVRAGPPRADEPSVRVAPAVDGRIVLRAQRLSRGDHEAVVIVLFLPSHPRQGGDGERRWGLSVRESEVARQIAMGASAKEIAGRLGISLHTARRHTERVFAKLGVRSRSQVVLLFASAERRAG